MTEIPAADGKASITLLRPALIRLTWLPDTEVLPADAKDVLEKSLALVDHVPYAILVDMSTILTMSLHARVLFGAEEMVLAAAMLGDTPMDRVLAASVRQSVHPVQFFTDESTALNWLISNLPGDRN
ncbi:hypothetical protein J7I84_07220 [Arthrobacter sp. ISL-85]|uniref:DUF7793 family protein n=1 Tax=Arthrobacter sp. ISL-85 TaxID=2819115 RepID=UPI001BE8DF4E|nr:hypothetical protein [Arthrobacter sp. ISL-85]MBT2566290.1 hypothetical protein [Arthrobacter sp. ISL-85]